MNNTLGINTDGVRAVEVQSMVPCVLKNKAYIMLCVGSSGLAQDFTPDMQQSDTSSTPLKCCQNTSYHCYKLPLLTLCSGSFHSIRKKQHLLSPKSFALPHQNSFPFSIFLLLSLLFVLSLDSLVNSSPPKNSMPIAKIPTM